MSIKADLKNETRQWHKTRVRRKALEWWKGLFYTQRVKEVNLTLWCDNGIIGTLTDADIELLYINRSK